MTVIDNVFYVELNSGNFIRTFVIGLELLKSQLWSVLREVKTVV